MSKNYGKRDIVRNPSLLRIAPDDTVVIEDKITQTVITPTTHLIDDAKPQEMATIKEGLHLMLSLGSIS